MKKKKYESLTNTPFISGAEVEFSGVQEELLHFGGQYENSEIFLIRIQRGVLNPLREEGYKRSYSAPETRYALIAVNSATRMARTRLKTMETTADIPLRSNMKWV